MRSLPKLLSTISSTPARFTLVEKCRQALAPFGIGANVSDKSRFRIEALRQSTDR